MAQPQRSDQAKIFPTKTPVSANDDDRGKSWSASRTPPGRMSWELPGQQEPPVRGLATDRGTILRGKYKVPTNEFQKLYSEKRRHSLLPTTMFFGIHAYPILPYDLSTGVKPVGKTETG